MPRHINQHPNPAPPAEHEQTFSNSASCVFNSCFFRKSTTSSTFRLEVMLRTMLIAFRRTSMSALRIEGTKFRASNYKERRTYLDRICKMSIMRLSRTCPCFDRRASRRSRTINLTLLSDSLMIRLMKHDAAAEHNQSGEDYM